MNIHKSLNLNKKKSLQSIDIFGLKSEKGLNNIKKLVGEMVETIIEKKREEAEENSDEDSIFHDIDVQAYKHKSQIFTKGNHNQLLNDFSLNKNNEENNISKQNNNSIRRKNKQITAKSNIYYSKNKISFHPNLKNNNDEINNDNNNDNNNDINEEEKKPEENIEKPDIELEEDKLSKKSGENGNNMDNEIIDSSLEYEQKQEQLYNNKDDIDHYGILYINPSEISAKENEELSTKNNEDKINDNEKILKKKPNIGKYLFEKGKKMIYFRNKKIEKIKEIRESKTKNFFDIKNFVHQNRLSQKEKEKEKTHIPLYYKSGELYKFHLTKIELNQRNNLIKKELEEKKEMKTFNKQKLNKNIWKNFLEREKQWKQNNINIKKKSLKKKQKKEREKIYDRPKINKESIIMLERKNKTNKYKTINVNNRYMNSITSNKYNNIHTKLYKDKEIYDNKLKERIYISLPTFSPKIIERPKSLNNNNQSKIYKSQKKIIFDHHKKANKKEKGIFLNDVNNNQKKLVTSFSTKQFNQSRNNLKKDINRNKKSKKTFVFELNINNSNYTNNNMDNSNIKKDDISSYIKKLGEKADKTFPRNKKYTYKKNLSENILLPKNKADTNNSNLLGKKSFEKNDKYNKIKELEINDFSRYLYNINTADHTSNNFRQFVVLTTKKYIDFFK